MYCSQHVLTLSRKLAKTFSARGYNLAHGLISPCKVACLIEFFAKNESELFFRNVLKQKPDYNFTLFSLLNSRCKWANRWREKVQSFLKRPPLDQQNGQALLVVRSSSIS